MSNGTVRRFCFTLNNYTDAEYKVVVAFLESNCKYGIVGKELGEKNGTPHLQGFCNLRKPMRFGTIKKSLGDAIHIEKANGSDLDNQKYCSKAGNYIEKGTPSQQGRRTDLETLVAGIQNGANTTLKVATEFPTCFIKYHRGISEYLKLAYPIAPRTEKTWVYYYWGPTGSGKSRRILSPQEQKKLGCTIIGDRLVLENPDGRLKRLNKLPQIASTISRAGSGGTVIISKRTLLLTTSTDGLNTTNY
nr:rep protein [Cyclovirus sp.]